MNIIWLTVVSASCIIILLHSPESILPAMLDGTKSGIELCLTILPIYVLWSGLIGIMDASGLSDKIARLLSPLTKRIFKGESDEAHTLISTNFSLNLLGAGGAATPLGIRAIHKMQEGKSTVSPSSVLFTVINTTSIQLIPSTVISLLTECGAKSPHSIILPTLIVSITSTLLAYLMWSTFAYKGK